MRAVRWRARARDGSHEGIGRANKRPLSAPRRRSRTQCGAAPRPVSRADCVLFPVDASAMRRQGLSSEPVSVGQALCAAAKFKPRLSVVGARHGPPGCHPSRRRRHQLSCLQPVRHAHPDDRLSAITMCEGRLWPICGLRCASIVAQIGCWDPANPVTEAIRKSGSISQAGRLLDMSYRRAWLLVDDMNRCFREPVVTAQPGGSQAAEPHSPRSVRA